MAQALAGLVCSLEDPRLEKEERGQHNKLTPNCVGSRGHILLLLANGALGWPQDHIIDIENSLGDSGFFTKGWWFSSSKQVLRMNSHHISVLTTGEVIATSVLMIPAIGFLSLRILSRVHHL